MNSIKGDIEKCHGGTPSVQLLEIESDSGEIYGLVAIGSDIALYLIYI